MYEYDSSLGLYSQQKQLTQKLKEKFKVKYIEVVEVNNLLNTDFSKFSYLIVSLLDGKFNENEIVSVIASVNCKVLILSPFRYSKNYGHKLNVLLEKLLQLNSSLDR